MNYYNEIDSFAASWLSNLEGDEIPPGDVDDSDIRDVIADGLEHYTQCHFFAGIGGWSHALRLAGVSSDVELWTGSCPCQPFSIAGKQNGTDDDRHLWPVWRELISECKPPIVFGEQVASPLGRSWLSTVRDEMEALGYGFGAADLCAAGVGAPHIRQRLFFGAVRVGDSGVEGFGRVSRAVPCEEAQGGEKRIVHGGEPDQPGNAGEVDDWTRSATVRLADTSSKRLAGRSQQSAWEEFQAAERGRDDSYGVGVSNGSGLLARGKASQAPGHRSPVDSAGGGVDWSVCDWVERDSVRRGRLWCPAEPGTFPMAARLPEHVGLMRGYGNAIVPQVAAVFIRSFFDAVDDLAGAA